MGNAPVTQTFVNQTLQKNLANCLWEKNPHPINVVASMFVQMYFLSTHCISHQKKTSTKLHPNTEVQGLYMGLSFCSVPLKQFPFSSLRYFIYSQHFSCGFSFSFHPLSPVDFKRCSGLWGVIVHPLCRFTSWQLATRNPSMPAAYSRPTKWFIP